MNGQLVSDFFLDVDFLINHVQDKGLRTFLEKYILGYHHKILVSFPSKKKLQKQLAVAVTRANLKSRSNELSLFTEALLTPEKNIKQRNSCLYDGMLPWIQNLEAENQNLPIHAVLTDKHLPMSGVAVPFKDCRDHDLVHTESLGKGIRQDARQSASLLAKLYLYSEQIVFIDKFFNPRDKSRIEFLRRHISTACKHRSRQKPIKQLKIHLQLNDLDSVKGTRKTATSYGPNSEPTHEGFYNSAKRNLSSVVPKGTSLEFLFWKEKEEKAEKQRFHNRYLLTENFGVNMGDSQQDFNIASTDDISLLEKARHDDIWGWFSGGNHDHAFKPTHESIIIEGQAELYGH